MEEEAIAKLVNKIFYGGFGEIITKEDLVKSIAKDKDIFKKAFEKTYGKDAVKGAMNFEKAENGNYYFNSFDLTLTKEDGQQFSKKFTNYYGNSFTLKEAYNMLDGRSVHKEFLPIQKKNEKTGEYPSLQKDDAGKVITFKAWHYLDFTEKDENGDFLTKKNFNYDLEKALSQEPIRELNYPQSKSEVKNSLERGNRQMVNYLDKKGNSTKKYIDANPRFGSINRYDENLNPERLREHSNLKAKNQEQAITQDAKELGKNQGVKQNQPKAKSRQTVRR
ncbi:MAG: hypothetical protein P0Y49_09465 [Candidatus Pedobacter colombiensis]|uniref:DUF3945 domain-containing protein n=1 Tax=Candidatus Pedobacter colombiensis TaxID=3121371 RepID=A0AAJ5W9R0_9SPHI|nr:hypothetical protein [Pedobacter sp.]WEK21368.1 MAG: hypothetical protein P0Y49_09465 [Pedobacter sp.]